MLNVDDRLLDLLDAKPLKLIMKIGSYMGRNGFAFPSITTLAKELRWNQKTVRTHLKTLVDAGVLETFARHKKDGGQTSNLYRILTPYLTYYVNLKGKGDSIESEQPPSQKLVAPPSQKLVDEVLTIEGSHTQEEKPEKVIETLNEKVARVKQAIYSEPIGVEQIRESMQLYKINKNEASEIFRSLVSNYEKDNYTRYINRPEEYWHKIVLQFDTYARNFRRRTNHKKLKPKAEPTPIRLKKLQRI